MLKVLASVFVLIATGTAVWQWQRHSASIPPAPGVLVIGGVDASGSTRDGLLAQGAFWSRKIVARLDPARDYLSVYRVDRQTHEITSGPAPTSARRFSRDLVREVRSENEQGGTYPAAFWQQAAQEAQASSLPVIVYFFSDGDNDDQSARGLEQLRVATRRLAANPKVRAIYLFGIESGNRTPLRAAFAGRPASQILMQSAGQIDIEPLALRVDALHQDALHQSPNQSAPDSLSARK